MSVALPVLADETYRIEAELGAGGGGVVYKAWHTRLQKHVVLKRIKDDSGLLKLGRARDETDILKNLKHANLPQLYDFLEDPSGIYTVMELIPGQSFAELLREGKRFSQPQLVRWAEQLSDALEYLHGQTPPVLHSDIKPGNIMLTPGGDVCLIDFNISFVLEGEDSDVLGLSHGYASPEQYGPQVLPSHLQVAPNSKSLFPEAKVKAAPTDSATEITSLDSNETELVDGMMAIDPNETTLATQLTPIAAPVQADAAPSQSASAQRRKKIRLDTRSDIYSLGATLYHLAVGEKPAMATGEVKTLSSFGLPFSEAFVYILERCMERDPSARFQTAAELHEALRSIHRHDTRWKISQSKRLAAAILLPLAFAAFAASTLIGHGVMLQEKETRYYEAVYSIQSSAEPSLAYQEALALYWDRIDPYIAMAKRLWSEGDLTACRSYIEENLGKIAEFQSQPEAARSFGDMYFILGNCYYYQSGEPSYAMARGNFEIAVQFVQDNPLYYRDYAIALARTGDIASAEQALETARSLSLDTDSLHLLTGEIAFAKQAYDSALEPLGRVVAATADTHLVYLASHTMDEIYKLSGQPERSVQLLSEVMTRLPLNRVPEMTERLADAYIRTGDHKQAIPLFEKLAEARPPQFHILQNLAILHQSAGALDSSAQVLEQMADLFPKDYRVPMRQAYLEADRQSQIDNVDRDYAAVKDYYDQAISLYSEQVKPGTSDPELQQLELMIEQLRANLWID